MFIKSNPIREALQSDSAQQHRLHPHPFADIGLVQGTELIPLVKSCAGDPVAYLIRGTVIAIRDKDSRSILVEHDEE